MFEYRHVDVFAERPLSGNGLTVFQPTRELSTSLMQAITQEMRQFESIFLFATGDPRRLKARIFTVEEELDFAGHPVIGAACVLHEQEHASSPTVNWIFELPRKNVEVTSRHGDGRYTAEMNQGKPSFGVQLDGDAVGTVLSKLNLSSTDLAADVPLEVVSTGLPYLIVPIKSGLDQARIVDRNFEMLIERFGAKFVYVLHVASMEGRTWNNTGTIEDIATGSAAGPVGAFLVKYGKAPANAVFALNQGRFVGRPSKLSVRISRSGNEIASVYVAGQTVFVGRGVLDVGASVL